MKGHGSFYSGAKPFPLQLPLSVPTLQLGLRAGPLPTPFSSIPVILSAQWASDVCLSLLIRDHEMRMSMESWTQSARHPVCKQGALLYPPLRRWGPPCAGRGRQDTWVCTEMLKGLNSLGVSVLGWLIVISKEMQTVIISCVRHCKITSTYKTESKDNLS